MELCGACGTENRDKAKFCKGCARALLPLPAGVGATNKASNRALRCRVCRAIHSRDAQICEACGLPLSESTKDVSEPADATPRKARRWPLLLGALALVGAVIGVWGMNQTESVGASAGTAAMASEVAPGAEFAEKFQQVQPAPLDTSLPTDETKEPSLMEASMTAAEKAHFEELVTREAERAEKARQRIARLAVQEQASNEARAAKAAADRQRAEAARPALDRPEIPAPAGAKAAATTTVPPEAQVSVEQACSKTANFLARDWCRINACREASNAGDPICLWYRKLEAERNQRLQGN